MNRRGVRGPKLLDEVREPIRVRHAVQLVVVPRSTYEALHLRKRVLIE